MVSFLWRLWICFYLPKCGYFHLQGWQSRNRFLNLITEQTRKMVHKIKHTHYLHKSCAPFETMTWIYFKFWIINSLKKKKSFWSNVCNIFLTQMHIKNWMQVMLYPVYKINSLYVIHHTYIYIYIYKLILVINSKVNWLIINSLINNLAWDNNLDFGVSEIGLIFIISSGPYM